MIAAHQVRQACGGRSPAAQPIPELHNAGTGGKPGLFGCFIRRELRFFLLAAADRGGLTTFHVLAFDGIGVEGLPEPHLSVLFGNTGLAGHGCGSIAPRVPCGEYG